MAFVNTDNQILPLVLIAVGILLVLGALVIVALKIAQSNKKKAETKQAVDQAVAQAVENAFGEIRKDYLVMSRNVVYHVGRDGEIAEGTYVLKGASAGQTDFNIRLNGLVENFHDGDTITLGTGNTISPVSNSVLLRPVQGDPFDKN